MFCPKCGSEIPVDTKFCPKCGEQIVKNVAVENVQGNKVSRKAKLGKIILLAVILIVILAVYKIINHSDSKMANDENADRVTQTDTSKKSKSGFSSYEDAIDALFTAAYDKDVEGVVNCFPEEMESHVKEIYNLYRASQSQPGFWSGDNLNNRDQCACRFFEFEKLNMDNEYWYEIGEEMELDQSDEISVFHKLSRDELQSEYGLSIDEAYIVEIVSKGKYNMDFMGETGYVTDGVKGYFEVAKIGKKWYLIQIDDAWNDAWF